MRSTTSGLLLGFALITILSCAKPYSEMDLLGTWHRSGSLGNYSLTFKTDLTFTEDLDNLAVDPCTWSGTYAVDNDNLTKHFADVTNRTEIFKITLDNSSLRMRDKNGVTFVYTKAE